MRNKPKAANSKQLELVFDNITYKSLDDALDAADSDNKKYVNVLSTGEGGHHFYDGELVLYVLNRILYSGMVVEVLIENNTIFLITKRLGVPMLYDVLVIGEGRPNPVITVFDGLSHSFHTMDPDMGFEVMADCVLYGTVDVVGSMEQIVNETIDAHFEEMDAMDQLTDPEEPPTIH